MPHERDARIAGKPVMGKGAVFQIRDWPIYKTGEINFSEIPNIQRIMSLDLGLVNDKTVISLLYWEPYERIAYLHRQLIEIGRAHV